MKRKIFFILLAAVFAAGIAFAEKLPVAKAFRPEKELYKTFANPDARHRPYVRWWWNGARVNEQEILRELDVMHKAGIGGVEINTIQFPDQTAAGCAAADMAERRVDPHGQRGADSAVSAAWSATSSSARAGPSAPNTLRPGQVQMLYPLRSMSRAAGLPSAATRCSTRPTPKWPIPAATRPRSFCSSA
ncbi:MAG: hypothetical protein ACLRQT_06760 [Alistipes sp.]